MIVIQDRDQTTGSLLLAKFLDAISQCCPEVVGGVVSVDRLGGVGGEGDPVWEYESMLDMGDEVQLPFEFLLRVAEVDDGAINELRCRFGSVTFGLSDSSYLFVDSTDPTVEKCVAERFTVVERIDC
ncbi:MAG: hypothetical protein ACRCT8_05050 [Lacipirellulaceae bacterium]